MAVPFLTNDQINDVTLRLLKDYHPEDTLPIPIEEIAELKLHLDIIPTPELQRKFQVDGFLSRDFSSIYVDDFVQSSRPTRYRYTLAHEVGHLTLHRSLLEEMADFNTVEEWQSFVIGMNGRDRDALEYQGYAFAGYLLVPKHHIVREFLTFLPEIEDQLMQAKDAGITRAKYIDFAVGAMATKLARLFDVSTEVIERRIKADGLETKIS
jgi:Zn-dependent peptidase ImmA (M78 family)